MPLKDLLRPTIRTIRWGGLVGSVVPATYIVWNFHNQLFPDAAQAATGLRLAAAILGCGLAFVLDDPTEESLGYTPVSILTRRLLRVSITLPPTILFWLLLRFYAAGGLPPEQLLPMWPFVLEAVALGAVALAGATLAAKFVSDRLGGPAGAGAVMLVGVALAVLPWLNGLLTRTPGTKAADEATMWWWAIIGAAAFAFWRSSVVGGSRPRLRARTTRRARAVRP